MEKLGGIAEFVTTVEAGSFVLAAQRLGMTPSGVSKAVSRLESRLSIRMFQRSTRRLTLTEAGAECYQKFRQFLADLDEMEHASSNLDTPLQGTLRVLLPTVLARIRIVPALWRFHDDHPGMNLRIITMQADVIDMEEESVDLAVRFVALDGANIISRRVGGTRYITCCAPAYVQRRGMPVEPEELLQHNCLRYVPRLTGRPRNWVFTQSGGPIALAVRGSLTLNNSDTLVEAAMSGIGIAQLPDYAVDTALANGTLVRILESFTAPEQPINAVYPVARRSSRKVTAFVEFLRSVL